MSDWEKHVVPDWVVDDYNDRVSKEDRLPIDGTKKYDNTKHNNVVDETTASLKRPKDIRYDRTPSDMISDWVDDNHSLTRLLIIIFSAAFAAFLVN
jgi:hypothetical protein